MSEWDDSVEYWVVEQFVELGNESFWHEKARFFRHSFHTEEHLMNGARQVGERDVTKYGGRYRIRVAKKETVFDSESGWGPGDLQST